MLSGIELWALMMYYTSPSLQSWQRTPWTTAWALAYVRSINLRCNKGWNHSCARDSGVLTGFFQVQACGRRPSLKEIAIPFQSSLLQTNGLSCIDKMVCLFLGCCCFLNFILIFSCRTMVRKKLSKSERARTRFIVTSRPRKGCGTPNCFLGFDLQSTLWSGS